MHLMSWKLSLNRFIFSYRYNLNKCNIPNFSNILEVGCGNGVFAREFVNYFNCKSYTALDIKDQNFSLNIDNFSYLKKSIQDLDINDLSSIDVIFAFNVLEHISYDDFLSFLYKLSCCKKSIVLFGVCPNPQSPLGLLSQFNDYTHLNAYSPKIVSDFCTSTFSNNFQLDIYPARLPLPRSFHSSLGFLIANLIAYIITLIQALYRMKYRVGTTDFVFKILKK